MRKPLTPIKTTPKPEKKPKEPKPVKQPREPKPPKEKKEKKRKLRKLDAEASAVAADSQTHPSISDPQVVSNPMGFPLSGDIFQQLPYLQSLLQFSTINPVSAQAIIQGNPAIMSMLANPMLMNLLAMSNMMTNPMNAFMPGHSNFYYPDGLSTFGLASGPTPSTGGAAAPFYVPPVDPSILTQFILSPDFSSMNPSQATGVAAPALETPSSVDTVSMATVDPVVKLEVKLEHDQHGSQMS
jgi:hypothetical protein